MNVVFELEETDEIEAGRLVYREEEYSFDFEPEKGRIPSAGASLLVNDLNIELDERGKLLYVWGLSPFQVWIRSPMTVPSAKKAAIILKSREPIFPGVSFQLVKPAGWEATVDISSGWICVGEPVLKPDSIAIAFCKNQLAVIEKNGHLQAIWLKPEKLPRALVS